MKLRQVVMTMVVETTQTILQMMMMMLMMMMMNNMKRSQLHMDTGPLADLRLVGMVVETGPLADLRLVGMVVEAGPLAGLRPLVLLSTTLTGRVQRHRPIVARNTPVRLAVMEETTTLAAASWTGLMRCRMTALLTGV